MKYKYTDLSDENKEKRKAAIEYFILSNTLNDEFLKQFSPPYEPPYSLKTYWEGCAQVLCGRGVRSLKDKAEDLLFWWQDKNWPGFFTVEEFVKKNSHLFIPLIKVKISEAYATKDIGWFKNLLELLLITDTCLTKGQKEKAKNVLEYLEDDIWKDFESKYNDFLKEML